MKRKEILKMKNHNELFTIKSSEVFKLLEKEVNEKIVCFEQRLDPEELKPDYNDDWIFYFMMQNCLRR